jgi:undecaprenyl-diphosphatase
LNWLAIVNPAAGFRRTPAQLRALNRLLEPCFGNQVVFTQGPGEAEHLARSSKADGLAVFGGDGTLAEAVNGMDLERQRLLLLPGGTGNGLARDLQMTDLAKALERKGGEAVRALDILQVDYRAGGEQRSRLVISTAAVGYAAEVVDLAKRSFREWGPWSYTGASIVRAALQPTFRVSLRADGLPESEHEISNVMVNNTRHAGNFRAFQQADPADGRFEVLVARAGFGQQVLHNIAVLTRVYFYATATETTHKDFSMKLADPQKLMLDGELWESVDEARFRILPGRLRCAV